MSLEKSTHEKNEQKSGGHALQESSATEDSAHENLKGMKESGSETLGKTIKEEKPDIKISQDKASLNYDFEDNLEEAGGELAKEKLLELQRQLVRSEQRHSVFKQSYQQMKQMYRDLDKKHHDYKQEVQLQKVAFDKQLEISKNRNSEIQEEIKLLNQQLEHNQEQLLILQQENQELNHEIESRPENADLAVNDLRVQLEDMQKRWETAKKELSTETESRILLKNRLMNAEVELKKLRDKVQAFEGHSVEEVVNTQWEIKELTKKLQTTEQALETAKRDSIDLNKKLTEAMMSLKAKNGDRADFMNKFEAESNELKIKLSDSEKKIHAFEQDYAVANDARSRLQNQLNKALEKIKRMQAESGEKKEKYKAQAQRATNKLEQIQSEFTTLQQKYERLLAESKKNRD